MRAFVILAGVFALTVAFAQVGPWPMERYDRWGTGRAPVGPDPATQVGPWIKYRVPGELVSHAPIITSDGTAYFGAWIPSLLTKFSTVTGAPQGSFSALNFVHAMPALGTDGRVYFNTSSPSGRVFAIDPTIMDYDWSFVTNSMSGSDFESASVTIGPDGDILVPSTTGNAWRLNRVTGLPVWTKSGMASAHQTMVFTRDDQLVLVANGNLVTALFYTNGQEDWSFNAGSQAGGPGVAPDGTIVFGSENGTVFGINPDGSFKWSWATLGIIKAPPAFSNNGRVYIGGQDRRLYCLDVVTGARLWSFTADSDFRQSPLVGSDGRIYIMDLGGKLYCLNPNGSLLWSALVPATQTRGEMSMDEAGTIYVAGSGIYAITQEISVQEPTAFAAVRGVHVSGGLSEILHSDNQYLRYRPGAVFTTSQAPVELTYDVICPRTQLARLKVHFESGATTGTLNQQLYLRDFQAGTWVEIDARFSTTLDSLATIDLNSNLNRFVQSGTRIVRLRSTWKQTGPVLGYPWQVRVDRVNFELLPGFVYP